MKTMRYFALAAAVAALAGCSKQEPAQIETPEADHEVYLTVRASSADTRTAISPDYAIRWAEGDAIGLFYDTKEIQAEWGFSEGSYTLDNGTTQNLYYPIASGVGTSAADFSYKNYIVGPVQHPASGYYSGNFYWQGKASQTTQATLYAYYPYYHDADVNGCGSAYNVRYMPFHLPTMQTGSLDEVAENDLAYASATIIRGEERVVKGEANFKFEHLFSILEITVENSLSDAVTVKSVTVMAAKDNALVGDCTFDLTTGIVSMGKSANSFGQIDGTAQSSVMLRPANGIVVPSRGITKLYAVVAPCDLSGATVRVTTTGGYQDFAVADNITTEAGNYYSKSVSLSSLTPHTIDFEDVQLGTESQDGNVGHTFNNVYSSLGADKSDWEMDDYEFAQFGTIYTADGVSFNSFYCDYEGEYKTWGGFGFSSNVTTEFSMTTDLAYQFHAMTSSGSDNKFSVMYDFANGLFGSGYESEINFAFASNPISIDVTNTPVMGSYMKENPMVTFVGYLSGKKSSEVTFSLVDVKEWTEVDLRKLGKIDRIEVIMSSTLSTTPFYVCLDNLKYTEAE